MRYSLSNDAPAEGREYVFHPVTHPADEVESPWHYVAGAPNALLLYAHPDDETIFAGGLLLAYPHWNWHLARFVHGGADRDADHKRAVKLYRGYGTNIVEVGCGGKNDIYLDAAAKREWYSWAAGFPFDPDVIFTHGFRGEYGHQHHRVANQIAHTLWDNVWDFYNVRADENEPQLIKGRIHVVPTGPSKRRVMETAYPTMAQAIKMADADLARTQLTCLPEYYTR